MYKLLLIISLSFASSLPLLSMADIYKHVDESGHVTYSNVKIKGSKKIDLGSKSTSFGTNQDSASKTKSSTPTQFPSVDNDTQKQRDQARKEILLSELAAERAALVAANKAYAEGEANPEISTIRNANGTTRTFRNVPKFQEKMKQLKMNVDVHQRNIILLEQEISRIK